MKPAEATGRLRQRWWRISHFHGERLGQNVPSLDAIEDAVDKRIANGETERAATLAVIEDFERSAAMVTARTTPLIPASGIVVAGAGILTKEGDAAAVIAFFAIALALSGLSLLAISLFTHAGRPNVGHDRARADIAFMRERLVQKESRAELGSFLSFPGFLALLVVIL